MSRYNEPLLFPAVLEKNYHFVLFQPLKVLHLPLLSTILHHCLPFLPILLNNVFFFFSACLNLITEEEIISQHCVQTPTELTIQKVISSANPRVISKHNTTHLNHKMVHVYKSNIQGYPHPQFQFFVSLDCSLETN